MIAKAKAAAPVLPSILCNETIYDDPLVESETMDLEQSTGPGRRKDLATTI